MKTKKPIHNGLNTHNHDHVMYPVNFSAINSTVNNPAKPIPPDELELELIFSPPDKLSIAYCPLIASLLMSSVQDT